MDNGSKKTLLKLLLPASFLSNIKVYDDKVNSYYMMGLLTCPLLESCFKRMTWGDLVVGTNPVFVQGRYLRQ